ncbi:FYN-binding protein 1-like isoform X4 [Ostrea edulis]|uniref:FYN-binding protein 1-like isoform X4 n=1 Tax=Ostrea edulis TaxID=37623 RepID=UPI0020946185|nr:FYN-binding protein 1-like isoform X4 [Ostrea edulis]
MDVSKGSRTGSISKSRATFQEDKKLGRSQPGNAFSSNHATTSNSTSERDNPSAGSTSKRNSKLNIPAAFLADKQEPAMNRPSVPKKTVTNHVEDTKPSFTPKPALKPKIPTDKESSVATILRSIKNAENNKLSENGDVSNSENADKSETAQPKRLNPFLARDLENKSDLAHKPATPVKSPKPISEKPVPPWKVGKSAESEKPTPPWKAPKPESDSEKPVPPWKTKTQNQKDEQNDKKIENVPPWKVRLESKKSSEESSGVSEEKPLPLWKQKNLQNKPEPLSKPEANKIEPHAPSRKVKPEPVPKDEDKPPPVSRLKSSPFLANQSELSKVIGGLKRASSSSDEPPPVLRNLKHKKSVVRKSLTRHFDQKKFYAVDIKTVEVNEKAPPKPAKLFGAINIESIVEKYKASLTTQSEDKAESLPDTDVIEELEQDELYEELPEEPVSRRPKSAGQGSSRASKTVSLIPDMASDEEEEEYDDTANMLDLPQLPPPPQVNLMSLPPPPQVGLTSLPPPPDIPSRGRPPPPQIPSISDAHNDIEQEEYQDAEAGDIEEEELEQDDVYEPLDDIQEEMDKKEEEEKRRLQEEKRTEKERKEKEEREKKEEQKRLKEEKKRQEEEKKRQEKEMKALKKKFRIQPSDLEHPQGEGDIKEDDKGGKNSLEVRKGTRVQLIRLTDNPKGKWLVKLSATEQATSNYRHYVGYVDSSNVEVDNTLIKSEVFDHSVGPEIKFVKNKLYVRVSIREIYLEKILQICIM